MFVVLVDNHQGTGTDFCWISYSEAVCNQIANRQVSMLNDRRMKLIQLTWSTLLFTVIFCSKVGQ